MWKHASYSRLAGKSKPFKTLIIFVDSEIDGLMFLIYSHSCLPQDQARIARVNRTPEHGSASQSSDLRSPPTCRSDEHTSELQSLMRTSYAVFCLKKKKKNNIIHNLKKNTSHN